MNLERSTAPASEPVTAAEVEEKSVLSSGWDSTTITMAIKSARQRVENETDRSLITQEWTMKLDNWPTNRGSVIHLPKGKVTGIDTFSYIDTNGDSQTLVADTDYYFSNHGDVGKLIPVTSWPSVLTTKKDVITIVYDTGYGAASTVPDELKTAIIGIVQEYYSNGEVNTKEMVKDSYMSYKLFFDYTIND